MKHDTDKTGNIKGKPDGITKSYFTVQEAAKACASRQSFIYESINAGRLRCFIFKGRKLIVYNDLMQFINNSPRLKRKLGIQV